MTNNDYLKLYREISIIPGKIVRARAMVVDFIAYNEGVDEKEAHKLLDELIALDCLVNPVKKANHG